MGILQLLQKIKGQSRIIEPLQHILPLTRTEHLQRTGRIAVAARKTQKGNDVFYWRVLHACTPTESCRENCRKACVEFIVLCFGAMIRSAGSGKKEPRGGCKRPQTNEICRPERREAFLVRP